MSVLHIHKENFDELVLKSEKPVLLDFWATWCGPCRMIAPMVEQIAEENDTITVGKIDVDENMELASRFGITSIPTLIVLKNGKVAGKSVGLTTKDAIAKLIEG